MTHLHLPLGNDGEAQVRWLSILLAAALLLDVVGQAAGVLPGGSAGFTVALLVTLALAGAAAAVHHRVRRHPHRR
jgi:hypothetical protein